MADTNTKGSRGSAIGDENAAKLLNDDKGHQDNFGRHGTDNKHAGTRENRQF
jgi:hypothetical protein